MVNGQAGLFELDHVEVPNASFTRTKYIDIRYHHIRKTVQDGTIDIRYCRTNEMIADLLTKPLSREQFERLRRVMGMEAH